MDSLFARLSLYSLLSLRKIYFAVQTAKEQPYLTGREEEGNRKSGENKSRDGREKNQRRE